MPALSFIALASDQEAGVLEPLNSYRIASGDGYCRLLAASGGPYRTARRRLYGLVHCLALIALARLTVLRLAAVMACAIVVYTTPSHNESVGSGDGSQLRLLEP